MTSYPGYSFIASPNDAVLSKLRQLQSDGDLARVFLTADGVYYRRARGKSDLVVETEVEPFRPGPTDPIDRLVPRRVKEPQNVCEPRDMSWIAYLAFYVLAADVGGLLAIVWYCMRPS